MLEHVANYLQLGLYVLPVCWPDERGLCACGKGHTGRAVGKAPLLLHGHLDASRDPLQVSRWWNQWPMANVAAALWPSRLVVLDLGKPSDPLRRLLVSLYWELASTLLSALMGPLGTLYSRLRLTYRRLPRNEFLRRTLRSTFGEASLEELLGGGVIIAVATKSAPARPGRPGFPTGGSGPKS